MRLTVSRTIASSSTTKTIGSALISLESRSGRPSGTAKYRRRFCCAGGTADSPWKSFPEEATTTRLQSPISADSSIPSEAPVAEPAWSRETGFRAVFERAPIGITVMALDGRPTACNSALQRILGYSEAELFEMRFRDITHPDDLADDREWLEELRRGVRDHYQVDKRFFTKDRRVVWGRVNVSLARDHDGQPAWAIATFEDITAVRAAQTEQSRLVHDLGERVKELTALHSAARLLDQELELPELMTRLVNLLPPSFQYPEITSASLSYGEIHAITPGFSIGPWILEQEFRTHDGVSGMLSVAYGEPRPESAEGPFLAEERRLIDSLAEILVTTLDRRTAERSLRRSQEGLTLALDSAGMGIWEWDFTNDHVTWSEQLERIAGLEVGSFPGTLEAFWKFVHTEDRAAVEAAIQRAVGDPSRGDLFEAETRFERDDGETRWIVAAGRVRRDAAGAAIGMMGMAHDVTGLRELEQQFRQSQKMEAMGHLAGAVAHDFNNLLTAIKGYSEFVIDALATDDKRRSDVEQISTAADRAAALTHQLLAFSRRQVLAPKVIDANSVVANIEKLLRRLIGPPVNLRVVLPNQVAAVRADPGQLEQVVMNLAVNARDAMPKGGTLTIETTAADFDEGITFDGVEMQPGPYVVIAVSDTGTGMTAETRSRLFEPFFTTKEKGRGTGLGLATVYGIVRQSGGYVLVYTELGVGTTFKVYLPRLDAAVDPVASTSESPRPLYGTERIVFVDDDEQVRILAERALSAHGYQVTVCASGEEALERLAESPAPVDLIVTDVVMPRMQGPDLTQRIRQTWPQVRVLYVTGFTERDNDSLSPAESILQKPFTPGGLLRRIRAMLDA
ncbi:MAG: PAS domain S-box protein [Gemmatimonadota bacterium]